MSEESKPPSVHSSIRLRAIPGHGRTPLLAFAILPCVGLHPRGFTVSSIDNGIARSDPSMPQPIWPGIMRPQPSGIIALTYRGTFLCQSQNSRPKPFRHPCVQWWRDFPHDLLSRRLLFLSRLLHGLPRYYMLSRGAAEMGSSSAYL